jgi:fatty-acyl-CoA synthase
VIVSKTVEGGMHRYSYREAHARARRLANALKRLKIGMHERVATLAWNGFRHFEIYYAVAGSGAVIHTINPRLFPDQIAYIANHAEDSYVFFDITFAPLVEKLAPELKSVKGFVAMTDRSHMPQAKIPNLLCCEELVEVEKPDFEWPSFDERTAACLCYTSGTTGNPKGALYAHRSSMLHAYAAALPDALNLSARDVVLPVVPMFHVNAWGLPYSCALVGAKMVFPGQHLDGRSLYELFESEGVTMSAGVPTVWLGLLNTMKEHKLGFSTL